MKHNQRNNRTQQLQLLRIPTCRRQTSWLFTSAAGKLNQGLPGTNSERDLNPWSPDLKASALTTRPHCLPSQRQFFQENDYYKENRKWLVILNSWWLLCHSKHPFDGCSSYVGKQGWHSGESTRLRTNVARDRFPDSTPYVGWVCWFSTLLREVFLRVLRFSPLLKNQNLQA